MTTKSITYLIRDIDDSLWQQARHRAVNERITLRELILKALEIYLGKERREGK